MILEGNITIPYKWTTGSTIGRFLGELKENARIVGARCEGCGRVYCPPPDVCGECFRLVREFVELTGYGTILAASVVERAMPWSPNPTPYTLALVRLDGADTNMVHLGRAGLQPGDRVRAVFRQERNGTLLDIECFAPAGELTMPTTQPVKGDTVTEESRSNSTEDAGAHSHVGQVFKALPSRFQPGKVDSPTSFYFSIDEEKWTVIVEPESCSVAEGKTVDDADCFLKTSSEIFLGTIRGTYTPGLADLVSGKVKTNNPLLLQTFKDIFG